MTSKPETNLVRKIRERATKLFPSLYHIKIHGGPYQEPGIPDILMCLNGKFIGMEIKMPGKEPSPKQEEHMDRIIKAGGFATCVDNIEDAINYLKQFS